jgi:ParB family transcriptional regulator, chromosome partitioning protein
VGADAVGDLFGVLAEGAVVLEDLEEFGYLGLQCLECHAIGGEVGAHHGLKIHAARVGVVSYNALRVAGGGSRNMGNREHHKLWHHERMQETYEPTPEGLSANLAELARRMSEEELQRRFDTRLESVPIDRIDRNPGQPRKHFERTALDNLAASIRREGVLTPILLLPTTAGRYMIVAGERRYRAAQRAGLTHMPANVIKHEGASEVLTEEMLVLALVENMQRSDLSEVDEAKAILEMLRLDLEFETPEQVTALLRRMSRKSARNAPSGEHAAIVKGTFKRLGTSVESFVANRLPILQYAPELQEMIRSGQLHFTKAKLLNTIKDPEVRTALMWRAIAENLSRADLLAEIKASLPDVDAEPEDERRAKLQSDITQVRRQYARLKQQLEQEHISELEALLARMRDILDSNATVTNG